MSRKILITLGWFLFITLLSAFPGNKIPRFDLFSIDKPVHFLMYAVFAFLALSIVKESVQDKTKAKVIAFLIATAYGFLIELAQENIFVLRSFDWADALANALGAFAGVVTYDFCRKILRNIFKV